MCTVLVDKFILIWFAQGLGTCLSDIEDIRVLMDKSWTQNISEFVNAAMKSCNEKFLFGHPVYLLLLELSN